MRNCGQGKCCVCGMTYIKQTHNSTCCGPECRQIKDNRRKAINQVRYRRRGGDVVSRCEVCGLEFVGRCRTKEYVCCHKPDCRATVRRLAGIKSVKTVKRKLQVIEVACNVCGKPWVSPSRFIRTCPQCKANQRIHETYCDAWGAVI